MTEGAEPSPSRKPSPALWRLATPVVVLLGGGLCIVAAQNADGTDLRPRNFTDIASIVEAETDEVTELTARASELDDEVEQLASSVNDRTVNRYNRRIAALEDPTGLTERSGTAVTVTLTDAPQDLITSTSRDQNDLVVHQQDIQAVVNAMWRGGAEAVTVQGQRVISTTGIKCSGNTVQLQGVPYSPPYTITAIGDQVAILAALQDDSFVQLYRDAAANPEIRVGYEVLLEEFATAPAYDGVLTLNYAVPMDT